MKINQTEKLQQLTRARVYRDEALEMKIKELVEFDAGHMEDIEVVVGKTTRSKTKSKNYALLRTCQNKWRTFTPEYVNEYGGSLLNRLKCISQHADWEQVPESFHCSEQYKVALKFLDERVGFVTETEQGEHI